MTGKGNDRDLPCSSFIQSITRKFDRTNIPYHIDTKIYNPEVDGEVALPHRRAVREGGTEALEPIATVHFVSGRPRNAPHLTQSPIGTLFARCWLDWLDRSLYNCHRINVSCLRSARLVQRCRPQTIKQQQSQNARKMDVDRVDNTGRDSSWGTSDRGTTWFRNPARERVEGKPGNNSEGTVGVAARGMGSSSTSNRHDCRGSVGAGGNEGRDTRHRDDRLTAVLLHGRYRRQSG